MLRNYIITALRNLKRHKLYSLINISGLAVGLAVFILAVTFFSFHLSFDNLHAAVISIFTALFAVGIQSIRAAMTDPIESLTYE